MRECAHIAIYRANKVWSPEETRISNFCREFLARIGYLLGIYLKDEGYGPRAFMLNI